MYEDTQMQHKPRDLSDGETSNWGELGANCFSDDLTEMIAYRLIMGEIIINVEQVKIRKTGERGLF